MKSFIHIKGYFCIWTNPHTLGMIGFSGVAIGYPAPWGKKYFCASCQQKL